MNTEQLTDNKTRDNMPNKLSTIIKPLHKLEDLTLVALVLGLVGLSVTQILLRNLADSGLVWAENALRILVLWIAMFGAMRASRDGEHISIDILKRYFTGKPQMFIALTALLFSAALCTAASYYSAQFVLIEREDGAMAFLSVPVWFCEAIIPLALACMALRFIFQAITLFIKQDRT